jgi:uncharacterized membrane protein YccC
MSAVPSLPISSPMGASPSSDGQSNATPQAQHLVSIMSPSVARAVITELMLRPEGLTDAMRAALSQVDGDEKAIKAALERMTIWADLSTLVVQGLHAEEKQRRRASMSYCILRQAHFGLLHRLFRVSRYEVQQLRQELGVGVETRPKIIPSSAIDEIHSAWSRICQEFKQCEADRWISLAEQFPQYGLNSLYQVVVKEGRHGDV